MLNLWLIGVLGLSLALAVIIIYCTTLLALLIYVLQRTYIKVPTLRTSKDDLRELIRDEFFGEDNVIYDLGSGNGETIFEIEKLTTARTFGYEMSIPPFAISFMRKILHRYKTKIYFKNFLKINIPSATIIYTYLGKRSMIDLEPSLVKFLGSGLKFISCDFPLPNINPSYLRRYKKHTFYIS